MKHFEFRAVSFDDKTITGKLQVEDEREVLSYLENNRLVPIEIREFNGSTESRNFREIFSRQKRPRLRIIDFTRSLGMLLKSGLPLEQALASVLESVEDENEKELIGSIREKVRSGKKLSEALEENSAVFGELYIQVISAGEAASRLDLAINYLTEYLQEKKDLQDNLSSMLIYPAILLLVTMLSVVVLMLVVIPKFKALFEGMNGEIPWITQLFINASDLMIDYGIYLPVVLLLLLMMSRYASGVFSVRVWLDRKILATKWIGRVIRNIQVARFSETLAMLMENGLSIQKSIEVSSRVITNRWMRQSAELALTRIREGSGFYQAFHEVYPEIIRQLVRAGEQSGELSSTLDNAAKILKNSINRDIRKYITVIEPTIILFLGVLVAAIISSILVAVLGMNDLVMV